MKLKHQVNLGYVSNLFRRFINLFIPNRILEERQFKRSRERINRLREVSNDLTEISKKGYEEYLINELRKIENSRPAKSLASNSRKSNLIAIQTFLGIVSLCLLIFGVKLLNFMPSVKISENSLNFSPNRELASLLLITGVGCIMLFFLVLIIMTTIHITIWKSKNR